MFFISKITSKINLIKSYYQTAHIDRYYFKVSVCFIFHSNKFKIETGDQNLLFPEVFRIASLI